MTAVDALRKAVPPVQRLENAAGRAMVIAETALLSGDDAEAALTRIVRILETELP